MIYEVSQPGSKIRLLAIQKFSRHAHNEWLEKTDTDVPLEFLLDFFESTSKDVQNIRSTKKQSLTTWSENLMEEGICTQYHEHEATEPVCTKDDIMNSFTLLPLTAKVL